MMKFKAGDRVHVTKLDNTKVNFYATLNSNPANPACFKLEDCSNSSHKEKSVWKIVTKGSCDYYTLATDEDSELSTIQHDKLIKDVEKLKEENNNLKQSVNDYKEFAEDHLVSYLEHKAIEHENETLKSENKALRLQADEYFELWQDELQNKESD